MCRFFQQPVGVRNQLTLWIIFLDCFCLFIFACQPFLPMQETEYQAALDKYLGQIIPVSPPDHSTLIVSSLLFKWQDNKKAIKYHLQVSETPDYAGQLAIDENNIKELQYQAKQVLKPYTIYYWRVRKKGTNDYWSSWGPHWQFIIRKVDNDALE
jgi:hypothetical protein